MFCKRMAILLPAVCAICLPAEPERAFRTIPSGEGAWVRQKEMVLIPLEMLEVGLPEGMRLGDVRDWAVVHCSGSNLFRLPHQFHRINGYREWRSNADSAYAPTDELVFPLPGEQEPERWSDESSFEGYTQIRLWDSERFARREGIRIYYRTRSSGLPSSAQRVSLKLKKDATGYAALLNGEKVLHFNARRNYQIDAAYLPGKSANVVPDGSVWRWALSGSLEDSRAGVEGEIVEFTPLIRQGLELAIQVRSRSAIGEMSSLLRILPSGDSVVLRFDAYRSKRGIREPGIRDDQEFYAPNQYQGGRRPAHNAPDGIYAPMLISGRDGTVRSVEDLLAPHRVLPIGSKLVRYDKPEEGQWILLNMAGVAAGIAVERRTHSPILPWFWTRREGRVFAGIEVFGAVAGGRLLGRESYSLILSPSPEAFRETFERLYTHPILTFVYPRRSPPVQQVYRLLSNWSALALDHLMVPNRYRRAILTNGRPLDPCQSIALPVGELIRLYERTGHPLFLERASQAALFVADWFHRGNFSRRGECPMRPDDGGIYQTELNYLLLSLARVWRHTHDQRLTAAIDRTLDFLESTRGGRDWGWKGFRWHAGGYRWDGSPIYHWPVNTNQFASVSFRLYQLTGQRKYLDKATAIIDEYRRRLEPRGLAITAGGGVSDWTRGVHLFTEAWEIYGTTDSKRPKDMFFDWVGGTMAQFWTSGTPRIWHSVFQEVAQPGSVAVAFFSPGYRHYHSSGSSHDIMSRIGNCAIVGANPELTRFALRDAYYAWSPRFGLEAEIMLSHYTFEPEDISAAWWFDPELLPGLYAAARRGWISAEEFEAALWKLYSLLEKTYIPLDREHGGWAAAYDADEGQPLRYLTSVDKPDGYEHFRPGEPKEIWGFIVPDMVRDHLSRYRSSLEPLVSDLLSVRSVSRDGDGIRLVLEDESDAAGLGLTRAALFPLPEGIDNLHRDRLRVVVDGTVYWPQGEEIVRIHGSKFGLVTVRLHGR